MSCNCGGIAAAEVKNIVNACIAELGLGPDTDTVGVPGPAPAAGVDVFGTAYATGDNIVTFPGGVICLPPKPVVNDGAVGDSRPYAGEVLLHDENVEPIPPDASIVPDQIVYKIVREDGTGQLATGKICGAGICVKFTGVAWMVDNAGEFWNPQTGESVHQREDYVIEWEYSDGSTSIMTYTGGTLTGQQWVPLWGQHLGQHLASRGASCTVDTYVEIGSTQDDGTLPIITSLDPSLLALEGVQRYVIGVCCPGVIPIRGTITNSSLATHIGRVIDVQALDFTASFTADIDCDTGIISNIVNQANGQPVPSLPTDCLVPC